MKQTLLLFLVLFTLSTSAHPVIYKGGWVYWTTLTSHSNKQRVSYTFHPHFSVEMNTEGILQPHPYRDYKIGINALLKRWYLKDSQGNIYLSLHGGFYKNQSTGYVLRPQIEMDWESRKLYTAFSASMTYFEHSNDPIYQWMYRIGVAPYVARMKELQTWFVFQLDYTILKTNSKKYPVVFTPMLRFFYRNTLWETGANLDGDFFITLMLHY